jgi:hypothetical protein
LGVDDTNTDMCRPLSWLKPASFPALTQSGDAKVAALLGLGWTEFSKMSLLNRFNRTGTTKKPVKPMGAEREKPFPLAVGQAQKNSNRNRILARMAEPDRAAPERFLRRSVFTFACWERFVKREIGQCHGDGAERAKKMLIGQAEGRAAVS